MRRSAAMLACIALLLCFVPSCASPASSDDVYTAHICTTAEVSREEGTLSRYILDEIERKFRIRLVFDTVSASGYEDKMKLFLSDTYKPDAILFNANSDKYYLTAIANGKLVPLRSYIGASENLLKYTLPTAWDAVKNASDDEIYMVPRTAIARSTGYCIRADWLENVGIELPDGDAKYITRSLFTEILMAFTRLDPDGNGVNDTSGIMPYPGAYGELTPLALTSFGCLGWQLNEKSNSPNNRYMDPKYELGNESFRQALTFTANMYKYGYIHEDWPITSSEVSRQFIVGQVGIAECAPEQLYELTQLVRENDPDARLVYVCGVKNGSDRYRGIARYPGMQGGIAVTENAEYPARIVSALNYLLSDDGWSLVTNGRPGYTADAGTDVPAWSEDGDLTAIVCRDTDTEKLAYSALDDGGDSKLVQTQVKSTVSHTVYSLDLGIVPWIASDPEFIEAEAERAEAVTRIIMGDMPVSAYDNVLANWYKHGGLVYIRQMNAIIADHL